MRIELMFSLSTKNFALQNVLIRILARGNNIHFLLE